MPCLYARISYSGVGGRPYLPPHMRPKRLSLPYFPFLIPYTLYRISLFPYLPASYLLNQFSIIFGPSGVMIDSG